MAKNRTIFRRLLIETLADRIAFHAGPLSDEGQLTPDTELTSEPAASPDVVSAMAMTSVALPEDGELRFTADGHSYYYDPALPADLALQAEQLSLDSNTLDFVDDAAATSNSQQPLFGSPSSGGSLPSSPSSVLVVPAYHSNASFTKKLYLDFDGHVASGTLWNNDVFLEPYNTGAAITAPAFSTDGDLTTFSVSEQAAIQEIWARVAEDYAAFQIDVTTEAPPASLFTAGSQAMRVVISTDIDAVTGQQWFPTAGGVAFLNSWTNTSATPAWVFANRLANTAKYIAEAVSHEAGHTFNLDHDGRVPSEDYYQGHGGGVTSWGPIMGVGYFTNVTQWSKGEYTSANNQEDDLAIINSKLPYITDDYGGTLGTATQLNVGTASTFATSGLITTRTDVDAIRFATQAGSIQLDVAPFDYTTSKNNLDAKITLLNSSGTVVASVDDVSTLFSTLTISVAKGFYTLLVDGAGRPAVSGDNGYSDYASIGKYSISGTIVPNAAPVVTNDSTSLLTLGSALIDVLGNDSDPNNDTLSILSVATPSAGSATIEAGKIRYTAGSATGQVIFAYTAADDLGVSSTGNVTVTINSPNTAPVVQANSASVTGNEGTTLTQTGTWSDINATDVVVLSASTGTVVKNSNGTWSWSLAAGDNVPSTNVTITANDGQGGVTTTSFSYTVLNLPPVLSINSSNVSGIVLSSIGNTGTYGDVAADTVTLTASSGTLVKNSNGTWSWTTATPGIVNNQVVTITATDEDGGQSNASFTFNAVAAVVTRSLFYNRSLLKSSLGMAASIDSNKTLLQSTSSAQTTSFSNVSNYSRGINGVVLNLAGLASTSLTAADFILRTSPAGAAGNVVPANWPTAPAPSAISVTPGTSTAPAQIALEWADNTIQDTWLQIIVRANATTGLTSPAVYYLGSVPGDINGTSPYIVTTADRTAVQQGISSAFVGINEIRDLNKDRHISAPDLSFVLQRVSATTRLSDIIIPPAGSADEGANSLGLITTPIVFGSAKLDSLVTLLATDVATQTAIGTTSGSTQMNGSASGSSSSSSAPALATEIGSSANKPASVSQNVSLKTDWTSSLL